MTNLSHAVVVAAPPERVWSVLVDWRAYPRLLPDVAWVRSRDEELRTGTRLDVRTKVLGVSAVTDHMRVVVCDEPRLLTIAHRGVVDGWGEWRLDRLSGGRTRFTWTERLSMPLAAPFGGAALAVYGPVQRWMMRRAMENVRRAAERPGRLPPETAPPAERPG